jgi:predicted O-linked N-acetylglucosamine transferase (SPINDLY family)
MAPASTSESVEALLRAAVGLHRQGDFAAAADTYRRVLAAAPQHAEALHLLGVTEQQLGRPEAAIALIERAIALAPAAPAMQLNLGTTLQAMGRHEEAIAAFSRALELRPALVDAAFRRGNSQRALNRHALALADYERVLAAQPGHAGALVGKGNALQRLQRPAESLACYDQALALQPSMLEVENNRGSALRALKRYSEAAAAFERLAQARPGFDYARSNALHSRIYACDWRGREQDVAELRRRVRAGERADVPFSFLAIADSAEEQLACARRYVADRFPPAPQPLWQGQPRRPGRLRLAYLSADFHEHATAYLMAGVFEQHDRERFETIAVSTGPDANDAMRARLRGAFEHWLDIRQLGDLEAARALRALDVDILVDLKGLTVDNRAGVLAHRVAPLQVAYLGYPGSSGADYIDYVVADERVLPPAMAEFFSEQVAWLPDSYQANDRARAIAPDTPTRAECGLPEHGFVFCCFNNSYKIDPETWAAWMRLLQALPDSVLWLIEDNADATRNLRAEADRAGVAPSRLVFAPRLPPSRHLARHRLADLFLDTLPCNAHTTASDALWAGLPLLTRAGNAFAGRVAASLLHALGLDELVAADLGEYEISALALARAPQALSALRARLALARETAPLFDTARFRRHLEAAYLRMWQAHADGEAPRSFRVDAIDERSGQGN